MTTPLAKTEVIDGKLWVLCAFVFVKIKSNFDDEYNDGETNQTQNVKIFVSNNHV